MVASLYDPAKYDGTNASLTSAVSPDGKPEIEVRYRIPSRYGVAVRLQAGQQLQVENTHGTVMSCCDLTRYQLLGCTEYRDNCTDNPRMALNAIGLEAPHVHDPFNLWMNIPITPDGQTSFQPTISSPGDVIGLRAIEDLVVVMSACPQDKNPINGVGAVPSEIHFLVEA